MKDIPERLEDVEITPEARRRFLEAIQAAARSGPKPQPRKRPVAKGTEER